MAKLQMVICMHQVDDNIKRIRQFVSDARSQSLATHKRVPFPFRRLWKLCKHKLTADCERPTGRRPTNDQSLITRDF